MKRILLYSIILCICFLTACVGLGPKGNFVSIVKFKHDYSDNAIVFLESYDGSINNPNPYFMRDKFPVKLINGYFAYPEIRHNSTVILSMSRKEYDSVFMELSDDSIKSMIIDYDPILEYWFCDDDTPFRIDCWDDECIPWDTATLNTLIRKEKLDKYFKIERSKL